MLSLVATDKSAKTPAPQMLSLARPNHDDQITVLGPNALDLTLQLCQLGYDEVVCRSGAGSPACNEKSRVVFIGGPVSSQQLILLLRDAASLIDEEGTLVIQLADVDQDRVVEATLAARGLSFGSTVFNLAGCPLVSHRVLRSCEGVAELQRVA